MGIEGYEDLKMMEVTIMIRMTEDNKLARDMEIIRQ
jgi:hypothetical protein